MSGPVDQGAGAILFAMRTAGEDAPAGIMSDRASSHRRSPTRLAFVALSILLVASGAALLGGQVWLRVKATVASRLINRAFEATLRDGAPHRPWSWADMYPIARVEVDRLRVSRTVLSGASGTSMAFGPGHMDGTPLPNEPGNCVLAGHRDTWFAFLKDLRAGDHLCVLTRSGTVRYIVERAEIVSKNDTWILDPSPEPDASEEPPSGGIVPRASPTTRRLTLVTCYPFSGITRSAWRYAVVCKPAGETRSPA